MAIKICLNMIVKNESAIIRRCLNSTLGFIDFVSITDTGSTDNTKTLVAAWCDENNIPFKIHDNDFINFGRTRTQSVINAKHAFPQSDYLLLMDADHVLLGEKQSKSLSCDAYNLEQGTETFKYVNTRLIKTSLDWVCKGATHEYWSSNQCRYSDTLKSVWIYDIGDGGCKSDKYERDIKLLRAELEDENEPNDQKVRNCFYLAETYRNLGKYEEAIDFYLKRTRLGHYYDEIYMSFNNIGLCYQQMFYATTPNKSCSKYEDIKDEKGLSKRDDYLIKACYFFDHAYHFNPLRSESLCNLATLQRSIGTKEGQRYAYEIAMKALRVPKPEHALFLDLSVYDWKIRYELSICAYYVDKFEQGYNISMRLIEDEKVPEHIKNQVSKNLVYYESKMKQKHNN